MVKLYRGYVIEVVAPAGPGIFKPRPVIVLQNVGKNADMITVYCTTQNDGDDKNNIFVSADSPEGIEMGISKDTYIRPNRILTLSIKSFNRILGKCPLMTKITKIIDDNRAV
jgi:hypothetical protein